MPGQVYVIETEDGFCKVGVSASPASRLAGLQTGNHRLLSISKALNLTELSWVAAYDVERLAHRYLARFRVSGEWFRAPRAFVSYCVDRAFFEVAKRDVLRRWRRRYRLAADAMPMRVVWFALMEGQYTDAEMLDLVKSQEFGEEWSCPPKSIAVDLVRR